MSTEEEKYRPVGSMHGHDSEDEPEVKYGQLNALQAAAKSGELDTVKALVTAGELNINESNYERYCAVTLAAEFQHWEIVNYLAANKADLNNFTTPAFHISPLYHAVVQGNTEQVKHLLLLGSKVNDTYSANHEHLLHLAIRYGGEEANEPGALQQNRLSLIRTLLQAKAYVDPQLSEGRQDTPLSLAILDGQLETVKLLQEFGAKVPAQLAKEDDGERQKALDQGLYGFVEVSENPSASFEAAFSLRTEDDKPLYGAKAVALGLYGCLRSRKPTSQYIEKLLAYSKEHNLDSVNTPISLGSSWISLLVRFNQDKVKACMEGAPEGTDEKDFTPYELAVIANKAQYVDLLKSSANEANIASAQKYATALGY